MAAPGGSLDSVVGEQLSSVTFVQNYVQLDFDGRRLTINEWPSVETGGEIVRFGEDGYRDALCSLIAKLVASVHVGDEAIILSFVGGESIRVDLLASRFPEGDRVIFHNHVNEGWSWW